MKSSSLNTGLQSDTHLSPKFLHLVLCSFPFGIVVLLLQGCACRQLGYSCALKQIAGLMLFEMYNQTCKA